MSITIIGSTDLVLIEHFVSKGFTIKCRELDLLEHMTPPSIAVRLEPYSNADDEQSFDIHHIHSLPTVLYTLTIADKTHSLATMGDVLRLLNEPENKKQFFADASSVQVSRPGNTYAVKHSHHSVVKVGVVQQALKPDDYFKQMFFEVLLQYLKPGARALSPHEMTSHQWESVMNAAGSTYGSTSFLTEEQDKVQLTYPWFAKSESIFEYCHKFHYIDHFFNYYCGYFHNGPEYGNGFDTNCRHEIHVEYALALGKDVPNAVIEAYLTEDWNAVPVLTALLKFPELRGSMSKSKLDALVYALHFAKIELTQRNVADFVQLARNWAMENPTLVQMDDFLYSQRILEPHPKSYPAPFNQNLARNPLSLAIRTKLVHSMIKREMDRANKDRDAGNISQREFDRRIHTALYLDSSLTSADWGNRIAQFIDNQNIEALISIFDTPDSDNLDTRQAIEEVTGVKLVGLSAKDRRAAIFKICGLEEVRDDVEIRIAANQSQQYQEALKTSLIEQLKRATMNTAPYGNLSLFEFLEVAVKDGHTNVAKKRKGKSFKYFLYNPQSGAAWPILKKSGALQYAVEILKLQEVELA